MLANDITTSSFEDADHDIMAIQMLSLFNGKIVRIVLVTTMSDNAAVLIDRIPAIQRFILVSMDGMVRSSFGAALAVICVLARFSVR
jgi:hypothetical protein